MQAILHGERDAVQKLSSKSTEDIPSQILNKLQENGRPLAFISDGLLAFEVFSFLRKKNIYVEVIKQQLPDPDFIFSLGIMLRKEDWDVVALLEDAQRQIFRSDWRIRKHIVNLFDGIERWLKKQKLTPNIIREWPADAPVFFIPEEKLASYIRTTVSDAKKSDALVKAILNQVEERRNQDAALKAIFAKSGPEKDTTASKS